MTDRVYPSAKPPANPNGNTNPSFPANKAQLYGASRPAYRPRPKPRRNGRSFCCCCCIWTTIFILSLALLIAIAGAVIWVLYRPQHPTFSVTSVRISQFNITTSKDSTSHLTSQLNLAISARNPNKKLVYFYDPMTIIASSNGVNVGNGSISSFVHKTKNTTVLRAPITSKAADLDDTSANSLKSDLKKKNALPLKIKLDTKVKVKLGGLKSNKVGIRVTCDGIQAVLPKGKTPATSSSSNAKCKVDLRIKIWKWTF